MLKEIGQAPSATYRLKYKPLKNWPHVDIGGTPATPGVDYSIDGKVLTLLGPAALHSSDYLFVEYDYIYTPPDQEPLIVGVYTHLNYDYRTVFLLGSEVQVGDFMLVWIWHWHSFQINDGWYLQWSSMEAYVPGENSGEGWQNRALVSKRISTEQPGDYVYPDKHHQGWRGAAVMQIFRGVPDSNAVGDIGYQGASITGESGSVGAYMGVHYGGGGPIVFSRGTTTVNEYDGTLGAAANQESLAGGQTVAPTANVGTYIAAVVRGAG
jgi:hypothetical protein